MDESTLYEQILGLKSPWFVEGVRLDEKTSTVHVSIALDSDAKLCCPTCSKTCPRYDSRPRRWRHLDTCQFQTLVEGEVPRVECPEHGCLVVKVPWAEERSRFTQLFEALVINWLKHASVSAVCSQFKMSWNAVDGIMQRAVARGLARRPRRVEKRIAVDEVSFKKGRNYVTIVSSGEGHVIDVQEGRSSESLDGYYSTLTAHQKRSLQVITMDMSKSYIHATMQAIPEASSKIAFDKFHVAKAINEAVDVVRRQERMDLKNAINSRSVKGQRFLWLRRGASLDRIQRKTLKTINKIAQKTGRAWVLKELAMTLWDYKHAGWAMRGWMKWYSRAIRSRLSPIKSVAKMVKTHLYGIINAVVLKADNALAESINSKIKTVKIRARGFRNQQRYKTAILFHCGGLKLYP